MVGIVASVKTRTLDEIRVYPEITPAFNAAKDLRRQALGKAIRDLGSTPGGGEEAADPHGKVRRSTR